MRCRRELEVAQNLARLGMWNIDLKTGRVEASQRSYTIYGIPQGEILSIEQIQAVPLPEDRPHLDRRLRELIEQGQSYDVQFRIRRCSDGAIRWVHTLADYDAEHHRVVGTIQDITARVEAERRTREREAYLRTILQTTADGFWVLDRMGLVLDVNQAYCHMSGFSRKELIGKSITDLDASSDGEGAAMRIARLMEQGSEIYESTHFRKNGGSFPVEVTATWQDIRGGQVICFARDLTHRRNQERHIGLMGEMLDAAPAAIMIHEADGNIVYANRVTRELHGYTDKAAFLEVKLEDLDTPESAAGIPERLQQIQSEGGARFEVEHFRKDGSRFPLEVMAKPVQWNGRPAVLSVAMDVSAKQRTQHALIESEAQLRNSRNLMQYIIEHANSAVAVHDRDLRYVYVSQRYMTAFGLSGKNILGKHHYEVFPDLSEKLKAVHQRVLKGEVCRADRDPMIRDNGEVDWGRWECRPWYEAPGKIGGIVNYIEIITDQVISERTLRVNEEFQRAIIASSPLAIITADSEGRIESWNEAATRIFGWEKDEVVGRFPPFVPQDQHAYVKSLRQRILKGETFSQLEVTRVRKSGAPIVVSLSTAPIRDHTGEVVRILAIMEDITEKKRLQTEQERILQELKLKKDAAECSNRAKDEFLAVMSHEMRTPLNAVLGFSNLLLDEIENPGQRSYLMSIADAGGQLLHQIENILNYVRLDRGTLTAQPTMIPLHDLCRNVFEGMGKPDLELDFQFHNGMNGWNALPAGLEVYCDISMLTRLLQNLLSNACKFTQKGSIRLLIGMNLDESDLARFRFVVEDTGIGIHERHHGQLFKPFSQVDSTYTRNFEGAGLGLATCKKLVDLLGGEIGMQSEIGKGSRFWFELPLQLDTDPSTM